MSRPASLRSRSAKGRYGKKLGIDWERADSHLVGMHRLDEVLNGNVMNVAQIQLQQAIKEGRLSSATRLRRAINGALEARLAIRHSWCPTCLAYLKDCTCRAIQPRYPGASVELIDRIQERLAIQNELEKEALKAARKQRRVESRKQRKLGLVNGSI